MSNKYATVIERWKEIPADYQESRLEKHFIDDVVLKSLDLKFTQIESQVKIGEGLKPDYLIYSKDEIKKPLIVIEIKRRDPALVKVSDEDFIEECRNNSYYRSAIGYEPNGIEQYLNKKLVDKDKLAPYGLVMNGDFFQLWKRIDGLVMPMTDIQRMTEHSIPELMKQLEYCLRNPHRALITAVWNQKGGVAKTTNTINIGAELALQGKRVLLIDLDEQNDLTRGLGLKPEEYNDWLIKCIELVSLRKSKERSKQARAILKDAIQNRIWPTSGRTKLKLKVLPIGKSALGKFRESSKEYQGFSPVKLFPKIIDLLSSSFDYIFIDTSPAADPLTRSLLYSVDTLLVPVDYGKKSIHHGVRIYKKLKDIRNGRKKLGNLNLGAWNLGLMYSNCPADAGKVLNQLIEKELTNNQFSGKRYSNVIKTYAQTKVAEFKHAPVSCWRSSHVTKCYCNLVNEVFISPNFIDE
ncbi:hypothetical protein Lepto7376_0691 [[Leptolyngbya] sp. PCC 7376]|uniref:ParA family protein n=1 Tax=[Leptolyngbya] sp. PCC 7376 TaxID=111781 RepID=UPI00029F3DE7|nr:ParA family protein [[Leptolyngbya] sp. PCC 7376]AFY37091.1 hypothetical protein Lepto7376_0691 [[Leptolyngbya] sp. PCC 7376]